MQLIFAAHSTTASGRHGDGPDSRAHPRWYRPPSKGFAPHGTTHFLWYAHCMMTTQRLVRELQLAVLVDVAALC